MTKQYVYLHREIVENFLGRKLLKDEEVHHVNGNKKDNRLENLEVLNIAQHTKKHFYKVVTRL